MPIFKTSDGVDIAYETLGPFRGSPLLLIHGFASTYAANWIGTGWVDLLVGRGMRVILFDNRGHGLSGRPGSVQDYKMERLTRDAVELLDFLSIERSFVMGYSMGGMVTLMAASLFPERWIKGVAAGVGENLLLPPEQSCMPQVARAFLAGSVGTESFAQDSECGSTIRMFYDFARANKQDLPALGRCLSAIPRPFPFEQLPPVATPVLLALGSEDCHTGPAEGLLPFVPTARVAYIPGRDHMRAVGDGYFKQIVLDFISE